MSGYWQNPDTTNDSTGATYKGNIDAGGKFVPWAVLKMWNFQQAAQVAEWDTTRCTFAHNAEGYAVFTATGDDAILTISNLPTFDTARALLMIRYRTSSAQEAWDLLMGGGAVTIAAADIRNDGEWHTLIMQPPDTGDGTSLRIDLNANSGSALPTIDIDFVAILVPGLGAAHGLPNGIWSQADTDSGYWRKVLRLDISASTVVATAKRSAAVGGSASSAFVKVHLTGHEASVGDGSRVILFQINGDTVTTLEDLQNNTVFPLTLTRNGNDFEVTVAPTGGNNLRGVVTVELFAAYDFGGPPNHWHLT